MNGSAASWEAGPVDDFAKVRAGTNGDGMPLKKRGYTVIEAENGRSHEFFEKSAGDSGQEAGVK